MTEQIKILESFKETFSGTDNINAIDTAIRSLSAWEEVLQELELLIKGCDMVIGDVKNTEFYVGKKKGYLKAIDIINQHLAEIEEVR